MCVKRQEDGISSVIVSGCASTYSEAVIQTSLWLIFIYLVPNGTSHSLTEPEGLFDASYMVLGPSLRIVNCRANGILRTARRKRSAVA